MKRKELYLKFKILQGINYDLHEYHQCVGANFKTIKTSHTGESQCPEKSRKYWIALRLRLTA
jgi:hypothetical protein